MLPSEPRAPRGVRTARSRAMSLVEAIVNVVAGYLLALAIQLLAFPVYGIRVSVRESMAIAAIFTFVSMARSCVLRRLFERLRLHGPERRAAALWRAAAVLGVGAGQLPMR